MILPLQYVAEWDLLAKHKQELINKSNACENSSRVYYNYKIGNEVLITNTDIQHKLYTPYKGPYKVVTIYMNGTVDIMWGSVVERISIRLLKPFFK